MEPFIGQVQIFGFNFAPRNWASCDGQLLPINIYTTVFALLGTTFGGDGRTTFGLPDLRGRSAVHYGSGPGLSPVSWGEKSGRESVTLITPNLPSHNHDGTLKLGAGPGLLATGDGAYLAANSAGETIFTSVAPAAGQLAANQLAVSNTGSNQSFDIRNPYLGILHAIALVGIFPSRT
ncbi:microcystin-dependent protein [Lewinella marina]|uniref:Phage tail protein n=1 Tax=Neolewinella marina TaxID=438751 RepID=A0A2G0CB60_9BACT|nr:tail fiber protein [Neolewinella marina]NJB87757.1 microcystin-dependent protein [Neolewinella marina]PHK97229.1 phage tail protein [Neolewinella marina]